MWTVSKRLLIPFEGAGVGEADLSWGQRNIWIPIRRHHTSLPLGGIMPLAAGITVGDVASVVSFLVQRHQALRTRVQFDPDDDRQARQVLASTGEIPLEVVDSATAGDDPRSAAQEVSRRFRETEFDYPDEWPMRCAVITHQGAPTYLVMVICHLSIDGLGIRALLLDLLGQGTDRIGLTAALETAGGAGSYGGRTLGTPPLEQALWQGSTEGRRANDQALQYWERLMTSVPARRIVDGGDYQDPRYRTAVSRSDAAYLAVQAIAGRLQVRTAPVLLAAYAAAFARVGGSDPVLAQILLNNRTRPGLTDSVSPISQPGLVRIDVSGAAFDQVVRNARRETMTASRYSYYDPYGQQAVINAVGERRGEPMDVRCFFNDRRVQVGPEVITAGATPDEVAEARARTTLAWKRFDARSGEPFMANVEECPGTISWSVSFDTHYISPALVESFLREMEEVLVNAAFDPAYAVLGLERRRRSVV